MLSQKRILLISFFGIFCLPHLVSQNSIFLKSIINNDTISFEKKITKIDSYLENKLSEKNYESIIPDIETYTNWLFKKKYKNYDKVISYFKTGIEISAKTPSPNKETLTYFRYRIGYLYKRKREYQKAIDAYKEAIKHSVIPERTARAYQEIAQCKINLGDLYGAINYYEEAIARGQHLSPNIYASLITNTCNLYKELNDERYNERGISLLKDFVESIQNNKVDVSKIRSDKIIHLYDRLGSLYAEKPEIDFKNAEQNYLKAIDYAYQLDEIDELGYIYSNLGYIYLKNNNLKAINYLNKALELLDANDAISICYSNKAIFYANNNDYELALYNSQKAIESITNFKSEDSNDIPDLNKLIESPHKKELLEALIEKGEILIQKHTFSLDTNDLNQALSLFSIADQLVDEIRFESQEYESKLFWRTIASRVYTNAVDICYKLNNQQALYYIEKNKALLLLEDINQKQYLNSVNLPKQILQKYKQLKNSITEQTQLLHTSLENTQDSLRLELIASKDNLRKFTDSLQTTKYAPYFKATDLAKVISLKEIQQALNNNTANINYIINDDKGYGIVITNKNHFLFKIKDISSLKKLTKNYQNLLTKPLNSKTELEEFNTVSQKLYTILIPDKIKKFIEDRDLIISPDYYLQNIPFETLKDNTNVYLIENHTISYTYSLTFLNSNSKINRQNSKDFLGFAPIKFSNNLSTIARSEKELLQISNIYKGDLFYNESATKEKFKNHIQDYNIIHLATHANANDSLRPWIAFHDELLSLDELYLTKNSAELVVLSACETGLGELKQGEGVMSLARGFFNTGANSVISTLWNVNDKSSSDIMTNFYKHLKSGQNRNEALHSAKLDYLKSASLSEQSPYYWASFILIGDNDSITSNHISLWLYLLIGIISFLILLFILKRKK